MDASDLAFTIERADRLKEGEELFRECCQLELWAHGPAHRRTMGSKHNLALCYANQVRLEEAIAEYRSIVAVAVDPKDLSDHDYLKTLSCLAAALDHQGHLNEAEELHHKVYTGYKNAFGDDHLLILRGRYSEAKKEAVKILEQYTAALGSGDFWTANK
ncbi:hypothetical protein LTR70_009450 [Exophiala xenobiotica]|nr:hypothetical protein LTR70_009450 [Exophiala xenobiotica]